MTVETVAWCVAGPTASSSLAAPAFPPGLRSPDAHGSHGSSIRSHGVAVRKE